MPALSLELYFVLSGMIFGVIFIYLSSQYRHFDFIETVLFSIVLAFIVFTTMLFCFIIIPIAVVIGFLFLMFKILQR